MSAWSRDYYGWGGRRSVAGRRAEAERIVAKAARGGRPVSPVVIEGRKIASTFWGTAWCNNLERYRDFAYRLERGRSYVRSGAVVDLQIEAGVIRAQVSGTFLYQVEIGIDAVEAAAWRAIQQDCAGSIGSLVDLLAGKLSEAVMARLCVPETGLFPAPAAIRFECSCPDHATMCKHVAATMYGVGARLDAAPELLFTLRQVSVDDLLTAVARDMPAARPAPVSKRILSQDGLGALFGIDLVEGEVEVEAKPRAKRGAKATRKPATKTTAPPAKAHAKTTTRATKTRKRRAG
ncbi:MAG TPA: hypothetical protein VM734_31275 [Kofleriaceae bacterium]|nr:hypothetical protein [Kofleriaceae bacterium]